MNNFEMILSKTYLILVNFLLSLLKVINKKGFSIKLLYFKDHKTSEGIGVCTDGLGSPIKNLRRLLEKIRARKI